jgi:hypothetical protein
MGLLIPIILLFGQNSKNTSLPFKYGVQPYCNPDSQNNCRHFLLDFLWIYPSSPINNYATTIANAMVKKIEAEEKERSRA